jgi:hypothetical protein
MKEHGSQEYISHQKWDKLIILIVGNDAGEMRTLMHGMWMCK